LTFEKSSQSFFSWLLQKKSEIARSAERVVFNYPNSVLSFGNFFLGKE